MAAQTAHLGTNVGNIAGTGIGLHIVKGCVDLHQGTIDVSSEPGKGAEFPFHDDYLNLDFPGLLQNRLRITGRIGFRKFANTGYYGFGNDSKFDKPWEALDPDDDLAAYQAAHRYHSFDHIYPLLLANARIRLWDRSTPEQRKRIEALVGINSTYNIVRPYPGSKLENDIASLKDNTKDAKTLAGLLRGTDPALLLIFNLGLLFDTRDHEFTPTRGTFTELSVRSSPGVQQGRAPADDRRAGYVRNGPVGHHRRFAHAEVQR